jgi:hypothetical protein
MLIVLLLLCTSFATLFLIPQSPFSDTVEAAETWWNTNWDYRKLITINSTRVIGSSNLTNFPILVHINGDSDIGGHCQANINDLRFINIDNTTEYKFEIENYTIVSGELFATMWVNITDLDHDDDTRFYIYYGNAASNAGQSPTDVWDSNYIMVLHLTGGSNTTLLDSTANNNDIDDSGGTPTYNATGKAGKSVDFVSASSEYLRVNSVVQQTFPMTAELWVYPEDDTNSNWILDNGGGGSTGGGICFNANTWAAGYHTGQAREDSTDKRVHVTNSSLGAIVPNTWVYRSVSWAGDTATGTFFLDETDVDNASSAIAVAGSLSNMYIGCHNSLVGFLDGKVDEIRISDIVRSDDWLLTSYNTVNSSSTFLSFGSEGEQPINNPPTQSGEAPVNGSTGTDLTPSLYVICTDADSDTMNATWRSNSSGNWVDFATNTSISTGTNITQDNSNFSVYSTTYWWSVNLSDGNGNWDNETYHVKFL